MKPSATAFFHILRRRGVQSINQLLARVCLVCGHSSQQVVCEMCLQRLQKPTHRCAVCGLALPAEVVSQRCQACIKKTPNYACLDYIANYEGALADWIVAAKVRRQASAMEAIELLVARYFTQMGGKVERGYHLLPMPIPQCRLMQRGFNLPLVLAKQISSMTGLPIVPSHVVLLPRYTPKQAKLSKKQREKRHYAIKIGGALPKKVLIVDDVVTTGTTMNQMASMLKENGVEALSVWALARSQWG